MSSVESQTGLGGDAAVRYAAGMSQSERRRLLREHEAAVEAGGQHEALVSSLRQLLSLTAGEVEELLGQLRQELSDELGEGSHPAPPEAANDAFERGLQLGLLVGFESKSSAEGPAPGRETERPAADSR